MWEEAPKIFNVQAIKRNLEYYDEMGVGPPPLSTPIVIDDGIQYSSKMCLAKLLRKLSRIRFDAHPGPAGDFAAAYPTGTVDLHFKDN